uniref:Uncharacterized protein n=2 Tax=Cacopsylla melanoneura TaxID=428564 RepID=A0A8D8W000_9HEMI
MGTVTMTAIPLVVAHLLGQYTILCNFIEKLGKDEQSREFYIYYEDLKTNKFILTKKPLRGDRRRRYEQSVFRQVIRFHQELIQFQHEFYQLYSTNMFIKIFFSNIIFSLFLYQLTLTSPSSISSALRYYKLVAEFVFFGYQHFFLCNSSDLLDNCNGNILRAVRNSAWMTCSSRTRKDLCFLVRRVQRPNHLRFYQGAVLSRDYFRRVFRVSYGFVNFLRFKDNRRSK